MNQENATGDRIKKSEWLDESKRNEADHILSLWVFIRFLLKYKAFRVFYDLSYYGM
jgi:hypothetical protein